MAFLKYRETKVEQLQRQIKEALFAYVSHAEDGNDLEAIATPSDFFLKKLAKDATEAKKSLREMMRKSPAWDEALDAWVINGNRTHEPDFEAIDEWLEELFNPVLYDGKGTIGSDDWWAFITCLRNDFDNVDYNYRKEVIKILNDIDKGIYAKGKRKARIVRSMLIHYGLWDETAHSECQRLFALIADELVAKKIKYKLYVSINPAHMITMSNPKFDDRGSMLVSCHSLNSKYSYKSGCVGYARDNISLIAFTVKDDEDIDNLYTRKTSRQMFFYEPKSCILLQSRMYKAVGSKGGEYGGINGYDGLSTEYRHLIQKEIAFCEGVPNLWEKPRDYDYGLMGLDIRFLTGYGFGGYDDWNNIEYCPILSIRKDWDGDFGRFTIGNYGLCFSCGEEIKDGILCSECNGTKMCANCTGLFNASELTEVHDLHGQIYSVCERCRDRHYRFCEECNEWYYKENTTFAKGCDGYVCNRCLAQHYSKCDSCCHYFYDNELINAIDENGHSIDICESCRDDNYHWDDDRKTYVSDNFVEKNEEEKNNG